jgi:hypothetical protein
MQGIDYAFGTHPAPTTINGRGYGFVGRYMSDITANDGNGKNLLPGELAGLRAAGLDIIIVEESTAGRMKGGHAAGVADAQHAKAVTAALGMATIPVYFACDFDAAPGDQTAINDYLDGAASVIGLERTGIYGGYYPVKRALDVGKARWAWQTSAWSGGQWDSRAQVRQEGTVTIGGESCDVDTALAEDFGQWPRPTVAGPQPGPEYPVPASLSATAHPSLTVSWPASDSPHWRVQVAADDSEKPGAVIDGGQVVVTAPHTVIVLPGLGRYWVRVQAAGNSPFTGWHSVTA